MMPRKYREAKTFKELKERYGFSPTEFKLARLADVARELDEWEDLLRIDKRPESRGLTSLVRQDTTVAEQWAQLHAMRAELAKECEALMKLEYPAMASIEASVETSEKKVSADPMSDDEWERQYGHSVGAAEGATKSTH